MELVLFFLALFWPEIGCRPFLKCKLSVNLQKVGRLFFEKFSRFFKIFQDIFLILLDFYYILCYNFQTTGDRLVAGDVRPKARHTSAIPCLSRGNRLFLAENRSNYYIFDDISATIR